MPQKLGKPLEPCGTYAAYMRHYRDGDRPVTCVACKAAKARKMAEYREGLINNRGPYRKR